MICVVNLHGLQYSTYIYLSACNSWTNVHISASLNISEYFDRNKNFQTPKDHPLSILAGFQQHAMSSGIPHIFCFCSGHTAHATRQVETHVSQAVTMALSTTSRHCDHVSGQTAFDITTETMTSFGTFFDVQACALDNP